MAIQTVGIKNLWADFLRRTIAVGMRRSAAFYRLLLALLLSGTVPEGVMHATDSDGTGNADMNTALRGTVPEGDYEGLAFNVAVPFDLNHGDPTLAAAPLNATGMFWIWQGGYRFVRIDMVPTERAADGPKGWFLHLGSTMCVAGVNFVAFTDYRKRIEHSPMAHELTYVRLTPAFGWVAKHCTTASPGLPVDTRRSILPG